jgi:hypothetical protein
MRADHIMEHRMKPAIAVLLAASAGLSANPAASTEHYGNDRYQPPQYHGGKPSRHPVTIGHGGRQRQSIHNDQKIRAGNNSGNLRNSGNSRSDSDSNSQSSSNANSTHSSSTTVHGGSYINHAPPRAPVASAFAPALVSGIDTCSGSTTIGAQGVGFGASFGNTWTDENCVMLKNSTMLWNMGQHDAALALMCTNEKVRKAVEAAGGNCLNAGRPPEPERRSAPMEPSRPVVSYDPNESYAAVRIQHRRDRQ